MTRLPLLAGLGAVTAITFRGARAQSAVQQMSVHEARQAALEQRLILVDIRTPGEWQESGIPDVAVALDMTRKGFVRRLLELREKQPDARIGLICAVGGRSSYVTRWLSRQRVSGVVDVPAGIHTPRTGWLARKLPVRRPGPTER